MLLVIDCRPRLESCKEAASRRNERLHFNVLNGVVVLVIVFALTIDSLFSIRVRTRRSVRCVALVSRFFDEDEGKEEEKTGKRGLDVEE